MMTTEKTENKTDVSRPKVWGIDKKWYPAIKISVIVLVLGLPAYYLLPLKTVGQVKNVCKEQDKPLVNINYFVEKEIMVWAQNPVIVNAIKRANEKATKSLSQIIKLDERWKTTEGVDEWVGSFLNNPCATYLKTLQKEKSPQGLYAEIFVMDKQGCVVAATNKTSDYWQGDEDKFIKSYADGEGAIFINKVGYDRSIQVFSLLQVSVPVLDPDTGKAVGAITVGLDLDVFAGQ